MMDDIQVVNLVKQLTDEATAYRDELGKDRSDATDYYNGVVKDLPAKKGKSQMVSKTVRSTIKKVMPSLMRTLLGNPKVFEFLPVEQDDEESAQQATDYINHVVFPEADGPKALHDGIHDALLLRSGIIKAQWKVTRSVSVSRHTGLGEEELAALVAEENVTVLEQESSVEQVEAEGPDGQPIIQEVPIYSVKIRRVEEDGKIAVDAVKLDEFLIHPDAKTLEDSPVVGLVTPLYRGDLVAMGYDKDLIMSIPGVDETDTELDQSRKDRVDADDTSRSDYASKSLQEIDYYELYVRVDRDDDGLNELLKICFAGGLGEKNLLEVEDWDKQPFIDLTAEEQPHQWQGASIADDTMDLQKVSTALIRETLDNIYATNKPQPVIQDGAIEDEDAVFNPAFGKPIRVAAGRSVKEALDYTNTPFVANHSFNMLEYFDKVAQDRTGVSEASSGMAPDALQNMTAKASAMIESAGIGQTEMIVRSLARGMRKLGSLLLHLVIQHQDKPRTVRLRKEWVEFDPRSWNASMDLEVNTGLGAGTRERDMAMLMIIKQIQTELLASLGAVNNPFVSADNLYNMLEKMTEAAGFPSAEPYFTQPDPDKIKQRMEQEANKPDPEKMKLEAQMQLEQAKMQSNRDKEQAQMQADLQVKQAEMAASSQAQAEELQSKAALAEQQMMLEREKMAQDRELAEMEMAMRRSEAEASRELEYQKFAASEFAKQIDAQSGQQQVGQ